MPEGDVDSSDENEEFEDGYLTLCSSKRHNIHLLRNSFSYASKKHWPALAKDLKPIYTAPSESAARGRGVHRHLGDRYPAIIKWWDSAWAEFVPFLQFDNSIRSVVCTTNAIESINARIRRAVNARGHFLPRRRR